MRTCAVVLTWNQYKNDRRELFERTTASLRSEVDELFVVDNHSDDGTTQLVQYGQDAGEWTAHLSPGPNITSGYGTSVAMRVARGSGAQLCIVSDDDMEWHPGFRGTLEDWWSHAPEDLALTGGHLEPEFAWNRIHGIATLGKTKGFLRASTGAASWTFLGDRWPLLTTALQCTPNRTQGVWDVPICQFLLATGKQIGQLDVAEHIGQGRSSWGNGTEELFGWSIEPVRAQLCA